MNQIATLSLTASLLLISPPAYADVNMLEGSFRTTFIDARVAGLQIERRYDSRSTFTGVFGFGWCSTFDSELDTRALKIKDCGKIAAGSNIRYVNGTYVQTLANGLTRTFDADSGVLLALRGRTGSTVAIERPSTAGLRRRLPRAAALGEGMKMRLEFDGLHENVIALNLPDNTRLRFDYDENRNLLSAQSAWSNTYRYDYDRLHNLTRISYPDGTAELIDYDADRDRLLKFQGRDGCIETYEHTISDEAGGRRQISTARLTCNGKPKREATFTFGFIIKGGRSFLSSFQRTNHSPRGPK